MSSHLSLAFTTLESRPTTKQFLAIRPLRMEMLAPDRARPILSTIQKTISDIGVMHCV